MDSDLILALQLQEEVNREQFKKQDENLSSKSPSSHNSIVSSQWEVYDPNPDIHNLFQVFNAKFFWDKLGCVEVKWSPRMYSCAGITTYKGMRGCIITLSLPLLKLRPRKDLVETLLHEMIHAYLFVADRNREREEHGPKFHSHMNRINKAAGTKITVYHSFHDEVKHYKNHWWRCNGPCQFRKPYFGLVKRSMNRAPGPNDFWFEEHRLTCGGEFIKIKEPDGFKSRKSKKVPAEKENSGNSQNLDTLLLTPKPSKSKSTTKISTMNKLNGIENNKATVEKFGKTSNVHGFKELTSTSGKQQGIDKFLSPYKPNNTSNLATMNKQNDEVKNNKASNEKFDKANNISGFKDKGFTKCAGKQQNLDKFLSPPQPSKSNTSNIGTINKLNGINNNNKASIEKFGKTNNVHGFKGLTPPSGKTNTGRSCGNNGGTALLSNRSGTLVERPKPSPSSSCANIATNKTSQQTSVSPKKSIPSTNKEVFSGRGHVLNPNCKPNEINRANSKLLKLFPESNNSNSKVENIPTKKPKLEVAGSISLLDESQNETLVNCPVCNQQLPEEAVNYHLDECINLEAIMKNICETVIIEDDDDLDEEIIEVFANEENVNCPVCDYKCTAETINQHLDECLQNT